MYFCLFVYSPSPSLKHKSVAVENPATETRPDEFSSGSLGGSIASGSSGFGSLPKKRPPLLTSGREIGFSSLSQLIVLFVFLKR